jgi:hypothetical protein
MGASLATGGAVVGALALPSCSSKGNDPAALTDKAQSAYPQAIIEYLDVDPSQVLPYTGMANAEPADYVRESNNFDLPLGSLVYQCSNSQALVITPGASSKALIRLGLVDLDSGELVPILGQALGYNEDYVIYDARASAGAIIWVECNMVHGLWRVLAAPLLSGAITEEGMAQAALLEEGNSDFDPPLVAASATKVYWTVMPAATGPANTQDSYLRCAEFTGQVFGEKPTAQTIYTSHGRMIVGPQVSGDTITIVPRVDTDAVYYQLTTLNTNDDTVRNIALLPPSLRVTDAVWLGEGFAFGIEGNYDYAKGLAYFGTYYQLGNGQYLYVNKVPTSTPVAMKSLLYVKSTKNVIGLDTAFGNAVIIPTPENCVSYGDILAAGGTQDRLVVFTTVTSRIGQERGMCRVRVLDAL